jgi:cyclase
VSNWIAACERIEGLDVETVVPGHGPITDKAGVHRVRDYLVYLDAEARARHAAGMTAEEAARDISFADFDDWSERERIVINVQTIYRELTGSKAHPDSVASFACMARFGKSPGITGR